MQVKLFKCFFIVVVFTCLSILFFKNVLNFSQFTITSDDPLASFNQTEKEWHHEWKKRKKNETKLILLYSTWFGKTNWWDMKEEEVFKHFETCNGPKNCLITFDRAWLSDADAVVFHGRDLEQISHYSAEKLKKLRKAVPLQQIWIYFMHENPKNDPNIYKPYDNIFNLTATFDRRSDIFVPYSSYRNYEKFEDGQIRSYSKEKNRFASWTASHCGIMREEYVKELQKYIDITVYGRCSRHFKHKGHCTHNNNTCEKELSTYKFHLAFENDFCYDYVTEKYWDRIKTGVIPVVMGANYDNNLIIPPGSYIDVSDFDSIKKLANYLLFLDKNDDEYDKYFQYTTRKRHTNETFFCRVCAWLHQNTHISSLQVPLSKVYNYKKNCGIYKGKREKIKKQIEESRLKTDSFFNRLRHRIMAN